MMRVRRSDLVREAASNFFLASSIRIGVRSINDGIEGFTNIGLVCGPCFVVISIIIVVGFVVGIGVGFRVGFRVGGVGVLDICIGCVRVGAVDVLGFCIGDVAIGGVNIVVLWSDSIGSRGNDPMGLGRTFTMRVTEGIGCGITGLGTIWGFAGTGWLVAQVVVVVWVVEFVVVGRLFCLKRPVLTKWVKYFL